MNGLLKRGLRGTGCGLCHTRVSLNEVQNHVTRLNALNGQFLEHVIPKDDRSSNELDDLSGRSFLLLCQKSFCLSKDGQKKDGLFLERVIPKDGPIEMLAYARLVNRNHESRYKKVCLTSSFFPGGRRSGLRCVAYLTTRALERGRQILENRRSFWCRALRGHLLCDEACDLIQF